MRIIYIANVRFPTERAHGIQIANTCSALAQNGAQVTLAVPARPGSIDVDPFDFYGLPRNFSVVYLSCGKSFIRGTGNVSFAIRSFLFIPSVFLKYWRELRSDTIFYGREEVLCGLLSLFSKKMFWETHMGSNNLFSKLLMRRAAGVVCITRALAHFYEKHSVAKDRLLVAPDAVDAKKFSFVIETAETLKEKFGLPRESFVVTYSGSLGLYSWKGADVFLDALQYTQDPHVVFLVVGGAQKEVDTMRARYTDDRIVFAGQVAPEDVREYLRASDLLVIPNKSGDPISEKYTSPMKLFEYMAAQKPIIASDLPSMREVLDDTQAFFFAPNDAKDLAAKIALVRSAKSSAFLKATAAYDKVREYSWENRAQKILSFIDQNDKRH